MCRHLAWLGPPRSLASLLSEPPFGLLRQSYAPRRQRHGTMNVDGFGAGWYAPDVRPEPARYRRAQAIWTDASFASFAGTVSAGCVVAAVRCATVGMPVDETATAPFTHGTDLLSHNGRVDPAALWPLVAAGDSRPESACDSALLATLVWRRRDAGATLPDAITATLAGVAERDPAARLNLLATDGRQIVATTWGDTLSYATVGGGVLVASEPVDDEPGWVDVPDRTLLHVTPDGVALRKLVAPHLDGEDPS